MAVKTDRQNKISTRNWNKRRISNAHSHIRSLIWDENTLTSESVLLEKADSYLSAILESWDENTKDYSAYLKNVQQENRG